MFSGCKNFNSDLSKWKVDSVTDVSGMFEGCKNFNQNLSNWKIDLHSTNTNWMFSETVFDGNSWEDYVELWNKKEKNRREQMKKLGLFGKFFK